MASMDILSAKLVQLIEVCITEDNPILDNYARENDGWIRLELLSHCKKLSIYDYDTILHALCSLSSNIIELSSFEPPCVRRRRQSITKDSIQDNRSNRKPTQRRSFSTRLNNHTPRVSLSNDESEKIRQRSCLKSNVCATEQILFCQNTLTNKTTKKIEYEKEKIVFNKYSYEFYKPDHLLKQIQECIIISLLNPHCFTIQFKQDAVEFDKFQREINEFYNSIDDKQYFITSKQIRVNLCVICYDSKSTDNNKMWNRSQILDFDSTDDTVNVFHVDLGTWEEFVPINRLRYITDRFQRHLVYSITCRLAHILPINKENDDLKWTDDATNQFLAVVEQSQPEIELLSFDTNACFHTNLFVINSSQYVCVNDYMIHIKKAKSNIDQDRHNHFQSGEHEINGNGPPVHQVIALYNRLGEVLQQSLVESRTASISSSSLSSPSIPRSLVKIILVTIDTHLPNRQEYNNQRIPIVFVRYQNTILIPDFNICNLLQMINSNISIYTIEHYAFAIRYNCVHISQESNFDIFTQLSSLVDIPYTNHVGLYTLDFVGYILEHYKFRIVNVLIALENAKHAQLHTSDLGLWFAMDNETIQNSTFTPDSNNSTKFSFPPSNRQSSIPFRLPFSNRLINLT